MQLFNGTPINVNEWNAWMAALRGGEYAQSTGALQDARGFCCLGVACDLVLPKYQRDETKLGLLKGSMPDEQINAPKWLKEISYDLQTKSSNEIDLAALNDSKKLSFTQIAKILQFAYDDKKPIDFITEYVNVIKELAKKKKATKKKPIKKKVTKKFKK